MAKNVDNNKSLKAGLKNQYRLILMEDNTLKELKTFRFSGVALLALAAFLTLLTALLTALLLSFTPLKYLIPGYADVKNNLAYMDLVHQLETIETELDAHRVYTNGMKNLLNPSGINMNMNDESQNDGYFRNNSTNVDNQAFSSNALSLEHYYFCSPLKGEVSAEFDLDKKHFGIDIVAEKNTPIKSILAGVVVNAGTSVETGKSISIQHNNDLISVFKHNSALLKKVGEKVQKGEAIAIIGNTGEQTSGPHVHIELWQNGRAVNPAHHINFE